MIKGKNILYKLDESRAELYDDRINFLGLTEPKEINYLTFSTDKTVTPDYFGNPDAISF